MSGSTGTTAPFWRPDVFARRRPFLEARARIMAEMRTVLSGRGYVEVETPVLQVSPGAEPHLEAFSTELRGPRPGEAAQRYLQTSPELAMKKLLVAGMPRIFQIARVFRNAEAADTHHPEFTMLEWYRAGAGYLDLVDDAVALLTAAAATGQGRLSWRGVTCVPTDPWERLTLAEAFERHAGVDLLTTLGPDGDGDLAALDAQVRPLGHGARPGDAYADLFFRVMLDRVEPRLGFGVPTVLTDYPAEMAALSRRKPGDRRLAERWELYVCGLELANAFGELTDPVEQRRRFADAEALRRSLYDRNYPVDEDFLAALEHGMPPAAGIALGVDRLVMLAVGAARIDDVLWVPVSGP